MFLKTNLIWYYKVSDEWSILELEEKQRYRQISKFFDPLNKNRNVTDLKKKTIFKDSTAPVFKMCLMKNPIIYEAQV